ncbi:sodium-extruding oxaloacetate decarboxylase subunit alpha [bacterium]|nr:sodium-extruding oxaloacetate decarboxylase subunit alpha [bacterium]
MNKKIGITEVVLRDAHQSLLATRMRTEDMLSIAEKMDKVGYWSIECWGGATFDSCIRFLREDPWDRLRQLKKAIPNTRLQMLLRGQNLLGYRHYADDVVDKFIERSAMNGIDVFRIFDALNDVRNLSRAIIAVRNANKHAQGTISYTTSPFHTVENFVNVGIELENLGCHSICIKDMAGLLTPSAATELVTALKSKTNVPISIHTHATTGMAATTLFKAIEAGCDMIDTAISSLSLGTAHAPTESMVAMLAGTKYSTGLRIDILIEIAEHFRSVRKKYARFESSFTGADARILTSQIPGGMLSNLENQLKQQNALDKLDLVMKEIPQVRKELGYPPLVTPTSQIVGTQAVLNILQGERYKIITAETRGLLAGRYGKTPTPVDPLIQKKALGEEEPITCRPADLIPPEMENIKREVGKKAQSIEDILSYALFPEVALNFFEAREKGIRPVESEPISTSKISEPSKCENYTVVVNGKKYDVMVSKGDISYKPVSGDELRSRSSHTHAETKGIVDEEGLVIINSPLAGRLVRFIKKPGDKITPNETILIIEAMKMETEIKASNSGILHNYFISEGSEFEHGVPLYAIKKD